MEAFLGQPIGDIFEGRCEMRWKMVSTEDRGAGLEG
jgi:hypothetical protein